jgi:hypothetical protein
MIDLPLLFAGFGYPETLKDQGGHKWRQTKLHSKQRFDLVIRAASQEPPSVEPPSIAANAFDSNTLSNVEFAAKQTNATSLVWIRSDRGVKRSGTRNHT